MNQIVTNRSKMLLTVNLKGGKSIHLRPKESVEVSDADIGTSEFIKHVKRGRLEVQGTRERKAPPKMVTTKKVATLAPPADEKPKDSGN